MTGATYSNMDLPFFLTAAIVSEQLLPLLHPGEYQGQILIINKIPAV